MFVRNYLHLYTLSSRSPPRRHSPLTLFVLFCSLTSLIVMTYERWPLRTYVLPPFFYDLFRILVKKPFFFLYSDVFCLRLCLFLK